MLKRRILEILLIAFFAASFIATVFVFSSPEPSFPNGQRSKERGNETNIGQQNESLGHWITHDAAGFFWLVIVGGIQLALFWIQLGYINESLTTANIAANAATDAAKAAKKSADHIPVVERAYVFATPMPVIENNKTVIRLRIENFGQTPGFCSEAYGGTSDTEPTGNPVYPPRPHFIEAVIQTGKVEIFPVRWESPITTPHYFFGYIKYTDIFKRGHISRVCKRILPAEGKIDMAGPPVWSEWD
jgi:hypothetical protein